MQNLIPNFRQSSIISKKPGYLSEKLKILMSSNYHKVYYFLLKFRTCFLFNNVYKRVFRILLILFKSWVINKNVRNECLETRSFWFLQMTQDLNKIKKSWTPFCRHWELGNVFEVSTKNIELYGSWSSGVFQTNLVSRKQ